jgi:C4-dicarboxylate-specific signal transduction histidine kinase
VLATLATQGEERTVQADPVALEHVVHQLLTHALQALAQVPLSERQLDLSALTHENQTVLTVRNSGPGLPMEAMTRLFDGDSAGRDGSTGLGNCWTLVQGMGGSLSVAHASPRGTVFRLALPLGD